MGLCFGFIQMQKLHSRWLFAALIQAPLSVSAVYAQSTPVDLPYLSKIVVTAARMPQPLADLVADVTIIDSATIQRSGATGVADVLARVPGIQISKAQRVELSALTNDIHPQYDAYGYNLARPVDDHSRLKLTAVGLNWLSQWSDTYSTRLSVTDSRDRYETTPSYYLTETNLRGYLSATLNV